MCASVLPAWVQRMGEASAAPPDALARKKGRSLAGGCWASRGVVSSYPWCAAPLRPPTVAHAPPPATRNRPLHKPARAHAGGDAVRARASPARAGNGWVGHRKRGRTRAPLRADSAAGWTRKAARTRAAAHSGSVARARSAAAARWTATPTVRRTSSPSCAWMSGCRRRSCPQLAPSRRLLSSGAPQLRCGEASALRILRKCSRGRNLPPVRTQQAPPRLKPAECVLRALRTPDPSCSNAVAPRAARFIQTPAPHARARPFQLWCAAGLEGPGREQAAGSPPLLSLKEERARLRELERLSGAAGSAAEPPRPRGPAPSEVPDEALVSLKLTHSCDGFQLSLHDLSASGSLRAKRTRAPRGRAAAGPSAATMRTPVRA
jgi:hypothetical protein